MPHITEELWHVLNQRSNDELLSLQLWPLINENLINDDLENSFENLFEIIRLIRNLRAELGLKPSKEITIFLVSNNNKLLNFLKLLKNDIKTLTRSSEVNILNEEQINRKDFAKSFSGITGDLEVFLPFEGIINFDSLKERLLKDYSKVNNDIEILRKRISNKKFIEKAPKEIVQECKLKLEEANFNSLSIKKKLEMLG
tara:strand:- start:352 stop:948 length:597 start_codon:yes stop_codon:yes gene_type:complete